MILYVIRTHRGWPYLRFSQDCLLLTYLRATWVFDLCKWRVVKRWDGEAHWTRRQKSNSLPDHKPKLIVIDDVDNKIWYVRAEKARKGYSGRG